MVPERQAAEATLEHRCASSRTTACQQSDLHSLCGSDLHYGRQAVCVQENKSEDKSSMGKCLQVGGPSVAGQELSPTKSTLSYATHLPGISPAFTQQNKTPRDRVASSLMRAVRATSSCLWPLACTSQAQSMLRPGWKPLAKKAAKGAAAFWPSPTGSTTMLSGSVMPRLRFIAQNERGSLSGLLVRTCIGSGHW